MRGLGIGSNARSQILQIFEIYDVQPKFVYSNGVYYRSDAHPLTRPPSPQSVAPLQHNHHTGTSAHKRALASS